jgi:hypothetical protein
MMMMENNKRVTSGKKRRIKKKKLQIEVPTLTFLKWKKFFISTKKINTHKK